MSRGASGGDIDEVVVALRLVLELERVPHPSATQTSPWPLLLKVRAMRSTAW